MDDVSPTFLRRGHYRLEIRLGRQMAKFIGIIFVVQFSTIAAMAGPLLQPGQTGSLLEVTNGNVRLEYNVSTGRANFYWQNSMKISGFYAGVELGTYLTDTIYTNHTWTVASNEVVVTSATSNLPAMTQAFIFDQDDSFLASVSTSASTNLQSNWMAPVIVDAYGFLNIGITNDNRALFVPFDNDGFVSYNSEPMDSSDVGNEVAAFYDNVSRNGLVVGSVTHDTWKTGIYWNGTNNEISQMNVFGGVTNHWTWDVMPHGSINGKTISSPVVFVGFNTDWRTEMENFANENLIYAPRLAWTNGVPFGWNSWGVTNYQENISYNAAMAMSDSIHTNLQPFGFTNNGTVYVNLDSYWSNLSGSQLQAFASHCHANGQKAGIYWTPFVWWGTAAQGSNTLINGDANYYYSDAYLRTSSGAPQIIDGGIALDPTHPGTQAQIANYIWYFNSLGYDYVKLDFLSHGALEGVHYDTNVTTGIEAFNEGMKFLMLVNQTNGMLYNGAPMFVDEAISPIFPYQYAQARRIACDAYTSFISNTEYTMNAVSCGWWIGGRLYQFSDPDDLVFDNGPTTNENQSRLINGVVTGLYLNGSILTNAASVARAQLCLTNAAINAVVRAGQTFRPVDGAAGTGAGNMFVQQNGKTWCIAVFNYTSRATNETVNLASAGLPAKALVATNLWNGTTLRVTNTMSVSLNSAQSKLFQLSLATNPPPPGFSVTTPVGGNQVVLTGTNGIPGWNSYVAAYTNVSLPMAQWQVIATNAFDVNGNVLITNPITSGPQQFYLLRM